MVSKCAEHFLMHFTFYNVFTRILLIHDQRLPEGCGANSH